MMVQLHLASPNSYDCTRRYASSIKQGTAKGPWEWVDNNGYHAINRPPLRLPNGKRFPISFKPMLQTVRVIADQVRKDMGITKQTCIGLCAKAAANVARAIEADINRSCQLLTFVAPDNWSHCATGFYYGSDLYITDITYQQFDSVAPDVIVELYDMYIKRLTHPYTNKDYVRGEQIVVRSSNNVKHFRQYHLRYWPPEQKPDLYCTKHA